MWIWFVNMYGLYGYITTPPKTGDGDWMGNWTLMKDNTSAYVAGMMLFQSSASSPFVSIINRNMIYSGWLRNPAPFDRCFIHVNPIIYRLSTCFNHPFGGAGYLLSTVCWKMLLQFHEMFILDLPEVTLETQVVTAPRDFGAAWCAPGAQRIRFAGRSDWPSYQILPILSLESHREAWTHILWSVPFPNRPNPSQSMQIPLISGL